MDGRTVRSSDLGLNSTLPSTLHSRRSAPGLARSRALQQPGTADGRQAARQLQLPRPARQGTTTHLRHRLHTARTARHHIITHHPLLTTGSPSPPQATLYPLLPAIRRRLSTLRPTPTQLSPGWLPSPARRQSLQPCSPPARPCHHWAAAVGLFKPAPSRTPRSGRRSCCCCCRCCCCCAALRLEMSARSPSPAFSFLSLGPFFL